MAKVKITGHASGSGVITVTAPNTSTDRTITLPDATATIATTADVAARLPSITDGGNATAITINSAENVGIGVVPEAGWDGSHTALQIGDRGALVDDAGGLTVLANAHYNSGWKYSVTDEATSYTAKDGKHTFFTAPSGTADTAISWTTAMTIDNSGRVIQHKKMYSIYASYGGSTGDLVGGTLVDAEGISFNTTTGKWTAPIAGLYQLGGAFYTNGDTTMEVYVKKNGTATAFLNNLTSNRNSFGYSVSTIMYLAANDTVGFSTLKGTIRTGSSDWRWIYRIG